MSLACRACRVPLIAEQGCAICDPIRPNLVAVEESEDAKPDLGDVGAETVAMLRKQLKHVRAQLDEDPGHPLLLKMALSIANTVAKMIEAARKLQVDADGTIRNMSYVARAKLFVGWYAELPPPYREQLRGQLERFEIEAAKPIKELSDGND
jgi:uncharacterized Zn finger protein (UPF0148 family)